MPADASSPPETASQSFSLTVSVAAQLMRSTLSLSSGEVGTPYSQRLNAIGGTTLYTWFLTSGSLPMSLTLNASTCGKHNGKIRLFPVESILPIDLMSLISVRARPTFVITNSR